MFKIKNILILVGIGVVLFLIYIYFIKSSPDTGALVSAGVVPVTSNVVDSGADSSVARDFLTLLLSVKNIKLNDTVFSDNAFKSLRDSSITLSPDGSEGRPNPFAPLGSDNIPVSVIPNTAIVPNAPVLPNTPTTITTPKTPVTPVKP